MPLGPNMGASADADRAGHEPSRVSPSRPSGDHPSRGFTPGPWYASEPFAGFGAIKQVDTDALVFGIAAGEPDEKQPDDVCDANARLIAAAPCMAGYIAKRADAGDAEAIALMEKIHGRG